MLIKIPPQHKVYNPLDNVQTSTSSLDNTRVGVCPKCGQTMTTALSADDEVYYCANCRVASPKES